MSESALQKKIGKDGDFPDELGPIITWYLNDQALHLYLGMAGVIIIFKKFIFFIV